MSEPATSTSPVRQGGAGAEYGASYFANYWGDGGAYERNERWLSFFAAVADGIVRDLGPESVLDAGCAMGFLVEALRERGVDAEGIDISEYAISRVEETVADHCRVASLTETLPRRYDLITCIEVLEHLPPTETDAAVECLCAATDRLLISTTPGDFGEPTHLNVQPPEAWSAKLAQLGFLRDVELDLSYISPWAALYRRREEPASEIVRSYDRAWWRLRREAAELRDSLLRSQEQVSRLEAETDADTRSTLQQELDQRNQEILELRDLLIGKDAELGAREGSAGRDRGPHAPHGRRESSDRIEDPGPRQAAGGGAARAPWPAELTADAGPALLDPDAGLRNAAGDPANDAALRAAPELRRAGSSASSTTAPPSRTCARSSRRRRTRRSHPGRPRRRNQRHRRRLQRRAGDGRRASSSPCSTTTTSFTPTPSPTSPRRSTVEPEADYVYTDEDKIDARGRHSAPVLQARLVAGAAADADVHLPPQRAAPARWSRRSAASTPSSRAPRTGT